MDEWEAPLPLITNDNPLSTNDTGWDSITPVVVADDDGW